MAVEVSAFTAMARAEFLQGKLAAEAGPPAPYEEFVTRIDSTVRVETHTFMNSIPRLREFKGYSPFTRIANKEYNVPNVEYRAGIAVAKTSLDDDQVGGYLMTINGLPDRCQRDVGHKILGHLALGTTNLGFDGAAFFADSHTIGSGDNLMTYNAAASDAATTKIIMLILTNPAIKPVIFQDREPLSGLKTDADTPQADKVKEYEYWVDTRFGLGYGFWWDAIHMTITDTPTLTECQEILGLMEDRARTFTLPKGSDADDTLYAHEGWAPDQSNTLILCSPTLHNKLRQVLNNETIVSSGAAVTNSYKGWAKLYQTGSLA